MNNTVANNNYVNKRDEIIDELKTIKNQFMSGNTSGKSFFGIEITHRIMELIGDKKLIDLSNNKTYSNWNIDFNSHEFIAIDGEEEKTIDYKNVLIID